MEQEEHKIIGSYSNQEEALSAVRKLKEEGYQTEDIVVYADKGTGAGLKNHDADFTVQTAGPDFQEGDILYLYQDDLKNGRIVITAGQKTHFDEAVRQQNKESNSGFGPDSVAAEEKETEEQFNADAIDPRETGADRVSRVTTRGMNTDPGKTSSDKTVADETSRASSANKPLEQDTLSRTDKDNRESSQADSPQHDKNMNLHDREDRVRDGYNREPLDYGVNADPSGRTLTPNAGNEGADVSPFNDMTEDIHKDRPVYDRDETYSGSKNLEDEGKTLTEEVNPRNDEVDRGGDKPVDVKDFAEDQDARTDKFGDDRDSKGRIRKDK